jgi:hypothetical protein
MESSERGKESRPGRENLGDREDRQDVLGLSSEARSRLNALLERPEFLSSEQRGQLEALVGPEWTQLGVDIESYRNWSARASALLRAIDQTPHGALSDSEWTALLHEARMAVDEAHTVARHMGFSASIDAAAISIPEPEVRTIRRIDGPEVRATRRIDGP